MITVGQIIPGLYPSFYTQSEKEQDRKMQAKEKSRQRIMPWEQLAVKARVEWIHPELRFAVIRFEYSGGRFFRECRALRRGAK